MLGLEGDRKGIIIEETKKYLREIWKIRNTKEKKRRNINIDEHNYITKKK